MLGEGYQAIGLGMWLAIIMAINVWFIIWPNQKRALIVEAQPEVTKSAKLAMLTLEQTITFCAHALFMVATTKCWVRLILNRMNGYSRLQHNVCPF